MAVGFQERLMILLGQVVHASPSLHPTHIERWTTASEKAFSLFSTRVYLTEVKTTLQQNKGNLKKKSYNEFYDLLLLNKSFYMTKSILRFGTEE